MAYSVNELNEMFQRAERGLQSHFAEIRSNIMLDSGFHHPKSDRIGSSRIFKDVAKSKRIRITKNHIQYITRFIRNSIQNRSAGGGIFPRNEKEISDQKSAEMNESVYQYLKEEEDLPAVYARIIQDFVVQGEAHLKVFWDPEGGRFMGYEETSEDDDPDEDPRDEDDAPSKVIRMERRRPRFKGKIVYERVPAYNYISDPDADSDRTLQWCCIRKFMPRKKLEARYVGQKEKLEAIKHAGKEKNDWFNGFTGIYAEGGSDEIEVREFYFKPCHQYPEGYFYFVCGDSKHAILEEGILPDGFCVFSCVYDESPENPRGYSPIRNLKSFQSEINRCAAAAITESIILGHSTILYPAGEKPQTTGIGNGIKGIAYHSVTPPTVMEGRSPNQYIDYMEKIIAEMYTIAGVPMLDEDKQPGSNDGQAMLGRALKDKMRFSLYGEKIESMICKIIDYSLKLARRYLPEDELIPIVGKVEAVNIAEFKNTQPSSYQIKIQPRSDDFTSVYGKSLQIIQSLQYVGNQLPPNAVASMVRKLPFLNGEAILRDFTIMEDQADAVIMALDRGEIPFQFPDADHAYMCQRLQLRMNEADFPMLSPQVQMNFQDRYDWHIQMRTQQEQEAAAATAGYLPSGGGLVSCDVYVQTPEGKTQRARLPYEAVQWLIEKLKQQGTDVSQITNQPLADQAALGRSNMAAGVTVQPQPSMPPPGPEGMPMTG